MLIAQFTPTPRGLVSLRTAHTLRQDALWAARMGIDTFDLSEFVRPGNSIEVNRNLAVQRALNEGATHLEMLDDDVYLPWRKSLLERLWVALPEHVAAAAVVDVNGGRVGKKNVFPVQDDAHYTAQYVSAAAILIDLHALARLEWPAKSPYFTREFNAAMTQCLTDEGFFFSRGVRTAGGKLVACNTLACHAPPSGR